MEGLSLAADCGAVDVLRRVGDRIGFRDLVANVRPNRAPEEESLRSSWAEISQETIDKLMKTMSERFQALICFEREVHSLKIHIYFNKVT